MEKEIKHNNINLRGHHLLCLQGYQGYTYDENFKMNLEKILKLLAIKKTTVSITHYNDDICNNCPNLKKESCYLDIANINSPSKYEIKKSNDKIVNMDLAILKKTKIEKGKEYEIDYLYEIVNKIFKTVEDLKDICGNCRWAKKCLWYQSKK
jgi:hypothetical protein